MTASLDSLQTTAQNIATALGTATQAYLNVNGIAVAQDLTVATLVRTGAGRLVKVSITTAGSGNGHIYDANDASLTTRPIYTIPQTLGVVDVDLPVTSGIVVAPGTGQHVTVSFS